MLHTTIYVRKLGAEYAGYICDIASTSTRVRGSDDFKALCQRAIARGDRRPPSHDWGSICGESGPGIRPFDIQWALDIVAQCKVASIPVFIKQLGKWLYDSTSKYSNDECIDSMIARTHDRILSRKGNNMAEWPADL